MPYLQYQLYNNLGEPSKRTPGGQTAIIWVIFCQNLGISYPVVPNHRVPPNYYAIEIKDIASRFNLNAFVWLSCVI